MAYNTANEPLSESFSGGTLSGLSVTNGYDQYLRRTQLAALNSTTPFLQHSFSLRQRLAPANGHRQHDRYPVFRDVQLSCQVPPGEPNYLQIEHGHAHDDDASSTIT